MLLSARLRASRNNSRPFNDSKKYAESIVLHFVCERAWKGRHGRINGKIMGSSADTLNVHAAAMLLVLKPKSFLSPSCKAACKFVLSALPLSVFAIVVAVMP